MSFIQNQSATSIEYPSLYLNEYVYCGLSEKGKMTQVVSISLTVIRLQILHPLLTKPLSPWFNFRLCINILLFQDDDACEFDIWWMKFTRNHYIEMLQTSSIELVWVADFVNQGSSNADKAQWVIAETFL